MKSFGLLLLLPVFAFADTYQCTDSSGKTSYFDRPCNISSARADSSLEDFGWIERLESDVPHGVQINSIKIDGSETTIAFSFAATQQSSQFLRLAAKTSGQGVALVKILLPKAGKPGTAEMKVSN